MKTLAWALLGLALSACSTAAPHPLVMPPVVRPDGRVLDLPHLGPCITEGRIEIDCPPRA